MVDSPDLPPAEDTICLQCGDQGYENALVYCVQCLEFAVHRYCLDDIPETMDEFVRWHCDDCKPKVSPVKIDLKRKCNDTPIVVEKVLGRVNRSFDKSRDAQAIIDSNIQLQPKKLNLAEKHNTISLVVEEDGQTPCDAPVIIDSNIQLQPQKLNLEEKHNAISLVVREDGQTPCVEPVGCNTQAQVARCHEPGLPVIDIIWEGSFKICNKDCDIFDGLVAHLSVKASAKVYKEAKSFPPMLKLEMLPKSAVWPKSFQTSEPTDENIALYFFPVDTRCERNFDYLVDMMMQEELAMRAVLTNAELLVFTSQELPLLYWRFQGKYYLWGVFRGKQKSSNSGAALKSIDNTISHSNDRKDLRS